MNLCMNSCFAIVVHIVLCCKIYFRVPKDACSGFIFDAKRGTLLLYPVYYEISGADARGNSRSSISIAKQMSVARNLLQDNVYDGIYYFASCIESGKGKRRKPCCGEKRTLLRCYGDITSAHTKLGSEMRGRQFKETKVYMQSYMYNYMRNKRFPAFYTFVKSTREI